MLSQGLLHICCWTLSCAGPMLTVACDMQWDLLLPFKLLACMQRVHDSSQKHLTPRASVALCTLARHVHMYARTNALSAVKLEWTYHVQLYTKHTDKRNLPPSAICAGHWMDLGNGKIVVLLYLTTCQFINDNVAKMTDTEASSSSADKLLVACIWLCHQLAKRTIASLH